MTAREPLLDDDRSGGFLSRLSFSAAAEAQELRFGPILATDAACELSYAPGDAVLRIREATAWGGTLKARLAVRREGGGAAYALRATLPRFRPRAMFKTLAQKQVLQGEADLAVDITWVGTTFEDALRSVDGSLSLCGTDLHVMGISIDDLAARLERTAAFTLLDLGAFFFVGPMGTVVTKGRDFAALRRAGSGRNGYIRELASKWELQDGMAEARDVALSTNRNRIALKGTLDLAGRTFADTTIALVDRNGIAGFSQRIEGPFGEPTIRKGGIIRAVAAPVIGAVRKAGNVTGIRRSRVFYSGSVAPP